MELNNLAGAIEKSGGSEFLLKRLNLKEQELESITSDIVLSSARPPIGVDPEWIRSRVLEEFQDLSALLGEDPVRSRAKIQQHVSSITMTPTKRDGERIYVADGDWETVENQPDRHVEDNAYPGLHFRMVAGAGFEPATFGL